MEPYLQDQKNNTPFNPAAQKVRKSQNLKPVNFKKKKPTKIDNNKTNLSASFLVISVAAATNSTGNRDLVYFAPLPALCAVSRF